jgi:hypothetical protein
MFQQANNLRIICCRKSEGGKNPELFRPQN